MLLQQVLSHCEVLHTLWRLSGKAGEEHSVTSTVLTIIGKEILYSPVWRVEALGACEGELTTAEEASTLPLFCKDRGKAR